MIVQNSRAIHYLDHVYVSLFIPPQWTSWWGLQDMKYSTLRIELYKLGEFSVLRRLFCLEKEFMHPVNSELITLKILIYSFFQLFFSQCASKYGNLKECLLLAVVLLCIYNTALCLQNSIIQKPETKVWGTIVLFTKDAKVYSIVYLKIEKLWKKLCILESPSFW